MTYRDLLENLKQLSEEELDQNATVQLKGRGLFLPVEEIDRVDDCDVLDDGQVVIVLKA